MPNYTLYIGIQPPPPSTPTTTNTANSPAPNNWILILVDPHAKDSTWYQSTGGPHTRTPIASPERTPYTRLETPHQNFHCAANIFSELILVGTVHEGQLYLIDEVFESIPPMQNQFFILGFLDRLMWKLNIEPGSEVWGLWSRAEFSVLEWRERERYGEFPEGVEQQRFPEFYEYLRGTSEMGRKGLGVWRKVGAHLRAERERQRREGNGKGSDC
ncbi:hypothetical protein BJY04DRAFT_223829 [Aspergillus karnatakaensis]|uniref:uncharacterized protein n=1 Tax=Aspergillus karnatakaensis TaxID=1810916 RepID=UPI003CCE14AF